jgi:methanogenic corrinoid protein MtbC1
MDKFGFPRSKPKQKKFKHGFRTGDIVRAVVPEHLKNSGIHVGRMSAKDNGASTIATSQGNVTDIGKKYCRCLQRADGYEYIQRGEAVFPPTA